MAGDMTKKENALPGEKTTAVQNRFSKETFQLALTLECFIMS
jgi:hypothetical protein